MLNELGDKLTKAQILFADTKELEKIRKKVFAKPILDEDSIVNDPNMSKEEKLRAINKRKIKADKKIEKDGKIEQAKLYGLGAAEIASGLIPATKLNLAGKIAQNLTKAVGLGRKPAKAIAQGGIYGAVSGSVHGASEGIKENKNPIIEGIKEGAKGLATCAATAGLGAKAEKVVKGKILSSKRDMKKGTEEIKTFRKEAKKYYQDYIQDTSVKHPEIGEVNLFEKEWKKP